MAFERDWDETTPTDNTVANQIDDFNRNLRKDTRERLAVDHNFSSSDTGQSVGEGDLGKHKKVSFIEQADLGTGAEGLPILGAQTVSGKAELVFTDEDDNDVQLTSSGKLSGTDLADDSVDEDAIQLSNNAGLQAEVAATGSSLPLIKLNTSDKPELPDGSVATTQTLGDDSTQLATTEYADTNINGDTATPNDSDTTAMLKAHAYLAQTSGFVNAFDAGTSGEEIKGYVGSTDDPAGAGVLVADIKITGATKGAINFFVPNGKYFEITSGAASVTIIWTPLVTGGGNPVDQD